MILPANFREQPESEEEKVRFAPQKLANMPGYAAGRHGESRFPSVSREA